MTRNHYYHYLGFAEAQWKNFQKDEPPRVKPLLYVYRVLLSGLHLMRTGEIESNLIHLNALYQLPYIDDLIARKQAGPEHAILASVDVDFHRDEYARLRGEMEAAYTANTLREGPTRETKAQLNDLLIQLRLTPLP